MRLVTAAESLEIDCHSLGALRSDHWLEIAGREMASEVYQRCGSKSLLFLCGPGNNGADGYVVARNLFMRGHKNIIVIKSDSTSELNQQKLNEIKKLNLKVYSVEQIEETELIRLLKDHLVIDAVFGVGLSKQIQAPWKNIFQIINKKSKLAISLDIPSGLDATTGNILGECIQAYHTLVVAPFKSGLFLNEGPAMAGQLHKIDIGFPEEIVEAHAKSVRLIGANTCKKLRPHRQWSSNKTHFGHVLVIGGSAGFEGAAMLTAEAALRGGAGYVSVISDSKKIYQRALADYLVQDFSEFENILKQKKISSVIFGPGLKISDRAQEIYKKLKTTSIPVVFDAGGFSFFESETKKLPAHWISTPHAGELSRLIHIPAKDLEKNRLEAAAKAADKIGGIILFKGFHTVVHSAGVNYIIASGNPSLAKSGTGDVLSGLIGSYLAQGLSPEKAAVLGAWVHGDLADQRIRQGKSLDSLMASDLIKALKSV